MTNVQRPKQNLLSRNRFARYFISTRVKRSLTQIAGMCRKIMVIIMITRLIYPFVVRPMKLTQMISNEVISRERFLSLEYFTITLLL